MKRMISMIGSQGEGSCPSLFDLSASALVVLRAVFY